MQTDLGPVLNAAYPQVVATLVRVLGDMDRATDAAQDALVKALQKWASDGVPDNPVAWLVTVGRNGAIDQLRREQRTISIDSNVVPLVEPQGEAPDVEFNDVDWHQVDDDLLRLLFTCCHPDLNTGAQMVLMLKVVLGFSVEEIARALLASPASIEKRITRAKARLKETEAAYEVPQVNEMPARLTAVLQAIYLLFNEGYSRIQDEALARGSLTTTAIRLGRITSRLFRHDPQPRSLLALMLLTAARLPARVNDQGMFVPMYEQDRGKWHQGMIREGIALVDAVYAARHLPGAYQIQAAISAIHSKAKSADETDWQQIVALYEKLQEYDNSPVVPVNRSVALCFTGEYAEAKRLLTDPELGRKLSTYQPYYAAQALLYERLGDDQRAREALKQALALADSTAQKRYLQARLEE